MALALGAAATPARAQISFTEQRLDALGPAIGTAINARGDVVGRLASGEAFSFIDGTLRVLPRLNGATMTAVDIDDFGHVFGRTGNSPSISPNQQAVRWQIGANGQAAAPVALGPAKVSSVAMGADGAAVGAGVQDKQLRRLAEGGASTVLATASGNQFFTVADANFSRQVVGQLGAVPGKGDAFVFDAQGLRILPRLGGAAQPSIAQAINQRGDIVGSSQGRAVMWRQDGALLDLSDGAGFGLQSAQALGVNDIGLAVGSFRPLAAPAGQPVDGAFVWSERGRMRSLGEGRAVAINRDGQVLVNRATGASLLTPKGTLYFVNADEGFFNPRGWIDNAPGTRDDSELDLAPSRLLDTVIVTAGPGVPASTRAKVGSDGVVKSLRVGMFANTASRDGSATLDLRSSGGLEPHRVRLQALDGISVRDGGRISGTGTLVGAVTVFGTAGSTPGGSLLVSDLEVQGGPLVNRGLVVAVQAQSRLAASLHNEASGQLSTRPGAQLLLEGHQQRNAGQVDISASVLQVQGSFVNAAGGQVNVTDGGLAVFDGPVRNDGGFFVDGNSTLQFNARVDGSGSIVQGSRPGQLLFGNGFGLGEQVLHTRLANARFAGGELTLKLSTQGHDQLAFDGEVRFSGGTRLVLAMAEGLQVQAGDRFDLFDWGGAVQGTLDLNHLPVLAAGLRWDRSEVFSQGVLSVSAVPEPAHWLLMSGGLAWLALLRAPSRRRG
ncbi:hypothetical protein [Aquabacterium sp. OR-4]|uniref:hypothetical protein n=1 Tax=Aquabacterium sp. OR-4 TaxID=2978127 RepID=UPI0021B29CD8|nr:hypothetical protein [Aquabacterium sp. OR-4]MDT7835191.1 hypothetical protein [Aquabacterium sp. OR-4]